MIGHDQVDYYVKQPKKSWMFDPLIECSIDRRETHYQKWPNRILCASMSLHVHVMRPCDSRICPHPPTTFMQWTDTSNILLKPMTKNEINWSHVFSWINVTRSLDQWILEDFLIIRFCFSNPSAVCSRAGMELLIGYRSVFVSGVIMECIGCIENLKYTGSKYQDQMT